MVKQINRSEQQLIVRPVVAVRKPKTKQNLPRIGLSLPQNPWLLRGFGLTVCVSLAASVALLTPIWSESPSQDKFSLKEPTQTSAPWVNSLQYQLSRPINILVIGFGSDGNSPAAVFNRPSDTLLLLRLDPNDKSVKVLSIPQTSLVTIPGVGFANISLANARGGAALASRTVSRVLNNITIDGYVRMTTDSLKELVDLLGGVEVFVPQRMTSQMDVKHSGIDLEPGWQTLNGEQALQFAQFTSFDGDLPRIQRQQSLIQALSDRFTSPTTLSRLPEFSRVMSKYIDTNFTLEQLMALLNFGVTVDPPNFQMLLLPGTTSRFSKDSNSYWLDAVQINRIMGDYFGMKATGITKPTNLLKLKIAIQNASPKSNSGQQLAKNLKQQGFTNVYLSSDLSYPQRQTQIIVQKGDYSAAKAVQKILGLGNISVAATGDLKSDLTIRLGKDWEEKPI